MDILLRDIDVGAVHIIDQLAKEGGLSRNEFLKKQLEDYAWFDKVRAERNRLEEVLIESVVQFKYIEQRLISQENSINLLKDLMMQALDVTEEELVQFEKDMNERGILYE